MPEESVLTHVTTVIPGIWKYKWYRIVAESGGANVNRWVDVTRDLYSDYKRLYPKEEPGRIVRVYLMADSDPAWPWARSAWLCITSSATRSAAASTCPTPRSTRSAAARRRV